MAMRFQLSMDSRRIINTNPQFGLGLSGKQRFADGYDRSAIFIELGFSPNTRFDSCC